MAMQTSNIVLGLIVVAVTVAIFVAEWLKSRKR